MNGKPLGEASVGERPKGAAPMGGSLPGDATTIPALFAARVAASGDAQALREFDPATGTLMRAHSWREWREASLDVATALVAAGGTAGASLAILAGNTALWPIAELGAVEAGMVTVGVYPTASALQLREQLRDAGVSVLVVDSPAQLDKAREATAAWTTPLLLLADVAPALLREGDGLVREQGWSAFVDDGREARAAGPSARVAVASRAGALRPDDIAMLIYTSGSTGASKGARISHRCVLASAQSVRDTLGLTSADSSLSFLPFCHAAERIFGLYTRIACGMVATLVGEPSRLWEAAVVSAPTLFGGMPRYFEKVYEALLAARSSASPAVAARWDAALALGRARARQRQRGEAVPEALEAQWCIDRAVIEPVLARHFGPALRLATSGGAALPREVAEYLDACGVTVLGAYGQTEHLCAAFNRPGRYRHDAVGLPMSGTVMRIAADGELQLQRSALTFSGYHRRGDDTAAAFTDDGAWLHTGDLGTIDADGFLRITGRIKELIALSNGKKVAPLPLETRLAEGPFIAHALMHGEGHPYLVALVTLRWPLVEQWQRARGIDGDRATIAGHPALRAEVAHEIERVNAAVSRPEQVRKFTILPHDLTLEAGELTSTFKVRRAAVASRYAAQLEALYQESA